MRSSFPLIFVAACNGAPPSTVPDPAPMPMPAPTADTETVCGIDVSAAATPPGTLGVRFAVTVDPPSTASVQCTLVDPAPQWRQFVPYGATWRSLANGSAAPPDWATVGFDDQSWPPQSAPFGYGHPHVLTSTDTAPSATSSMFRHAFEVDDPSLVETLRLTFNRDDALLVYLNGAEATRDNLPGGIVTPDTEGLVAIEDDLAAQGTIDLDPTLLVTGSNLVAVALHQTPGEADAYFDLGLHALVDLPPDPPEVHLTTSADAAATHDLPMYGLLADSRYSCTASTDCAQGEAFDWTVPPLDTPVPVLARPPGGGDPSWGAYTLMNHAKLCGGDSSNRLVVVDPEGRIRWTYEISGLDQLSTLDIESTHLGDGRFLYGGGEQVEGRPGIVTLDHVEEHRADFPGATETPFHHDIEQVGTEVLGLFVSEVVDGPRTWEGFDLLQYDPDTQQVTWEWKTQGAYDAGTVPSFDPTRNDPWHANAIASVDDAEGSGVYVSLFYDESIVRVDRTTGALSWRLGRGGDFTLVDPSGAALPDDAWFDGMHAIDTWGDHLVVYNNGGNQRQSEAMEIEVDASRMEAVVHWSWTEHGWFEDHWGDADPLPNDNLAILMAPNCAKGNVLHGGALVEVDRQTDAVIWRLDLLDRADTSYRSERIDGCSLFANSRYCPDVAARLVEPTR